MEHLEVKAFRLKLDGGVDDAGQFDGYAAVFGNVDSQGDLIEPGAFTKTLSEKDTVPILWQHNPYEPIGSGKAEQDRKGLRIKGRLNLEVQRAREARALMQGDEEFGPALGGLSIGYKAIGPVFKGSGKSRTRHLPEIKLYEFSPVTFPANALAGFENVKSLRTTMPLPGKAGGQVMWDDDMGFIGIRDELCETLNADGGNRYIVRDVHLNGDGTGLALVSVWDGKDFETFVVPFSDDEANERLALAPAAEWKPVEQAWIAENEPEPEAETASATVRVELLAALADEMKAGRVLSADNEAKIRAVVTLLQALLASTGPGGKGDGAAVTTPEPEVVSTLRALADTAKADHAMRELRRVKANLA